MTIIAWAIVAYGILLLSTILATTFFSHDGSYFETILATSHASDDEFLSQMHGQCSSETALKVRRAIAYSAGMCVEEIHPDTTMQDLMENCADMNGAMTWIRQ